MADKSDKILKLFVKFEDSLEEIQLKEPISLGEIVNKIAEQFKIPKDKVKNLVIYYFDEEDDIVPLEEEDNLFDISIKDIDGEPGIFFSNKNLLQFLKDWQAMKELLASGNQTNDNYEIWKTIRPSVTKVNHEK